jgi:hypothetical protein
MRFSIVFFPSSINRQTFELQQGVTGYSKNLLNWMFFSQSTCQGLKIGPTREEAARNSALAGQ